MKSTDQSQPHHRAHEDTSALPLIEMREFQEEQQVEATAELNLMVYVSRGTLQLFRDSKPILKVTAEELMFIPAGYSSVYYTSSECKIFIFRLDMTLPFYRLLSLEQIYFAGKQVDRQPADKNGLLSLLKANPTMLRYIKGLGDCMDDGLTSRDYLEVKFREFLHLLRSYNTWEQLYDFFCPILTPNILFSEQVKQCYEGCKTTLQLAEKMGMSPQTFARRFGEVFENTPYRWMKERKIEKVQKEILEGRKTNVEIAVDNGFESTQQFYDFCKEHLKDSPSRLRIRHKSTFEK
jgi:AraC-like DNA-binding protein